MIDQRARSPSFCVIDELPAHHTRAKAANAVIESDAAGNIEPSKARSSGRIDGVVALVMALGLFTPAPPPEPEICFRVLRY